MYWYVSIYSEESFWPQYMYPKLIPFNGYRWCPLGKLSHLGLEQLCKGIYFSGKGKYNNKYRNKNTPLANLCSHKHLCLLDFTTSYRHMCEFTPKACVILPHRQPPTESNQWIYRTLSLKNAELTVSSSLAYQENYSHLTPHLFLTYSWQNPLVTTELDA